MFYTEVGQAVSLPRSTGKEWTSITGFAPKSTPGCRRAIRVRGRRRSSSTAPAVGPCSLVAQTKDPDIVCNMCIRSRIPYSADGTVDGRQTVSLRKFVTAKRDRRSAMDRNASRPGLSTQAQEIVRVAAAASASTNCMCRKICGCITQKVEDGTDGALYLSATLL